MKDARKIPGAVYVVCGADGPVETMARLSLWSAGVDPNRGEDAKKIPGGRVVQYVPIDALDAARAEGAREEREKVVRWLRGQDHVLHSFNRKYARRIEEGSHAKG